MNPAYEVHLEMFEGPLDLLLFLIRKDDLDIYNIPIAHITQEYLDYLELMKEINLDVAGEFLVMAATLLAIKSRALLPSHEEEVEEGPDPQAELVARLLEYQKFKEAAKALESRAAEFKDIHYRGEPHFDDSQKSLSIGFLDLLEALKDVLSRCEEKHGEFLGEEFPIEDKIAKILSLLETRVQVTWEEIFGGEKKRRGIISCFLALLELIKLERILARQERPFGRIVVFKRNAIIESPNNLIT
ncbi:MAG: segregation/condensation protein A [Elusimicrobia bacterium]|nr:segregation/condensation protein A [Elusimicrobiota bacterium]